jgi:hypothetical protein
MWATRTSRSQLHSTPQCVSMLRVLYSCLPQSFCSTLYFPPVLPCCRLYLDGNPPDMVVPDAIRQLPCMQVGEAFYVSVRFRLAQCATYSHTSCIALSSTWIRLMSEPYILWYVQSSHEYAEQQLAFKVEMQGYK